MLKLGVVNRRGLPRPRTWIGRRRHVSLLLLRDLVSDPSVTPEEYDRLAGYARMPNGVWKRTRHGRLRLVDAALLEVLQERVARGARITVCDVAASTGATSVELYRLLAQHFDVDFVATDLYRDVLAVCSRTRRLAVVLDHEGNDVQYVAGPFVLPGGQPESPVYPVNRTLRALLRRRFLPKARAALALADVEALAPFASSVVGPYEVVRLPVLTRETVRMLGPGFRFEPWDVLAPFPLRADVVRAMNILTREHFDDVRRRRALRNCVEALKPGGLLVVGWSPTPESQTVEASIYEATEDGLRRLRTLNGGSEIDALVASTFRVSEMTPSARQPTGTE